MTTQERKVIELALNALQTLHDENMDYLTRNKLGGENNQCMVFAREAITAIKDTLAQEQEPVAWITPDGEGFRIRFSPPVNDVPLGWDALYTTPPQRKPMTDEEIEDLYFKFSMGELKDLPETSRPPTILRSKT